MEGYLSARRKELGKTQKEVADYVGVTEATVSRWESGNIANMRRDKIQKYAEILETTPSQIMNLDNANEKTAAPEGDGERQEWVNAWEQAGPEKRPAPAC